MKAWLAARRLGHAALGRAAPWAAGRIAAGTFSSTRPMGARPDDVLPLGAHRFTVNGDPDVSSGYLWGDEGPTALLVHGWGADSSSMQGLVAPLRSLGYRVAAFDAPGHGAWAGTRATMTQFTRATRAVATTLGDVRVIVAHSLGAIAAVGAVAQRPALPVDCLTLVAPAATLTGVLERWSRSELRLRRPIVRRIYRELHRTNGVPVAHWDVLGLGGEIGQPVMVIYDPGDDVVPPAEAQAVAAGLRDARLTAVPGQGHYGILTAPEVRDIIGSFVASRAGLSPAADPEAAGLLGNRE
jgi:pimeloyl-ACP methyl ester carboxylesterase